MLEDTKCKKKVKYRQRGDKKVPNWPQINDNPSGSLDIQTQDTLKFGEV